MNNSEIWNEFCFHVNKHYDSKEDNFQTTMEFMFEKLGWSQFKGEIESYVTLPVGSSRQGIADIVVNHEGKRIIVIELKRAHTALSNNNADQLRSYMRLMKLDFGILLGKTLQVYFEQSDKNEAVRVCNIPFVENSDVGAEILAVLSKDGYSYDNLTAFCTKCLAYPEIYDVRVQQANKRVNSLDKPRLGQSRSGNYGSRLRGIAIYEAVCRNSANTFVGRKNIESILLGMTRHEIEKEIFHFNDTPSSNKSSWITGERFRDIYEASQ